MSFENLIPLIIEYRYWILIPLSILEGPMIAFAVGTLAWLGYFNPYLAFGILFVRDVIMDALFYFLGRFGGNTKIAKRMLHKIRVTDKHLDSVRLLWEKHAFRTMFFSKLSYGISAAFLLVAGIVRMRLSAFLWFASIVALLQYGILFALGYFFGNTFGSISNILEILHYVIGGIVLATIAYYIFTHFMRKKLLEQEKEEKT